MRAIGAIRPYCDRVLDFGRACALAGAFALCAPAAAAGSGLFIVNLPWTRPAAAGASTDVYMNLRSSDGATLVGIRCELAATVSMELPDNVRRGKFRAVTRISLPAGETVRLVPGQSHFRLVSLRRPLKLGEHVVLVLTLEAADGSTQEVPVNAEVRRRSPSEDEMHAHGHPGAPAAAH
jgi:copper(I)-binding protein